jgi:type II restriction enzyme
MSKKKELREQRLNTIINETSKKQENDLSKALEKVVIYLNNNFKVSLFHERNIDLVEIITSIQSYFDDVDFAKPIESSNMRPDGGILFITDMQDKKYPILITEVKNQGTNDLRLSEGKPKQAQGNAIERLGKNVIGFRTLFLNESIFPFVCFGYGCDFAEGSSILDRVKTIAMFGNLNKTYVMNQGPNGVFNRGSFYFREPKWSEEEMVEIMSDIASKSIQYYFSKYGKTNFIFE